SLSARGLLQNVAAHRKEEVHRCRRAQAGIAAASSLARSRKHLGASGLTLHPSTTSRSVSVRLFRRATAFNPLVAPQGANVREFCSARHRIGTNDNLVTVSRQRRRARIEDLPPSGSENKESEAAPTTCLTRTVIEED